MMNMPNMMPAGFTGQPQRMPGAMPQFAPQPFVPQQFAQPSQPRFTQPAQFPGAPRQTLPTPATQPPQTKPRQPSTQQWQPQQQQPPQVAQNQGRIQVPLNPPRRQEPASRVGDMPAPPPTIRLQSAEETPAVAVALERPRLALPSPEKLGIGIDTAAPAPAAPAVDWNDVHARLQRLGAISFQMERLGPNGHRVTFILVDNAGQPQRIESEAATIAEAVHLALQRGDSVARR